MLMHSLGLVTSLAGAMIHLLNQVYLPLKFGIYQLKMLQNCFATKQSSANP